ncbi:metallophosphoesterase [Aminivibrio sp.]|uniref:metallophosphoesterase n=1 Tax=Aminivibrio sp. TaxID=1872489 RepID=UPI001A406709|nr:metallophosphoesterase [Aminivibrio sp.]MBL3540295.1 metallophosphoesterase [Aminivibrio sp.]
MRLIGILITVTLAAHYSYIYVRLRNAVGPGWKWTVLYAAFALFLVFGSRALWQVDLGDYPEFRKVLSYSVYMGLAFFFILFTAFVAIDMVRFLAWLADTLFSTDLRGLLPSPRGRAWAAVGFALLVCAYGWFEALNVQPRHVTIETKRLPAGTDRIRIAQITDVHLGWIIQEKRLDRILSVVRAAEPDLVVSTGDLVDDNMEFRDEEIALFRGLIPPLGIYAVTGNHEYHAGVRQAVEFNERAGMKVLRNKYHSVGGLVLVGMDDPSARHYGEAAPPEQAILASLPGDRFVVLLKHQPKVEPESVGLFDLQLSGHTHGGQIWPFYWLTRMVYEYRPGLRTLTPSSRGGEAYAAENSRESSIYVSNGAGTWGPPLRFFAPPEVTIFDIVRKNGS